MATNFGSQFTGSRKISQRDKLMFLAIVGLVVSLVLLIFVFSSRAKATQAAKVPDASTLASTNVGTITLYASDKFIRQGSKLGDYTFKPVYWPRNSVPEGAVRDLAELTEMYAKVDIANDQPIQRAHITKQATAPSLPITPGMRAVTIAVDDKSGIEGWAQPGTRVDVILTYTQEGNLKSKIIVENARVLSLGGDSRSLDERMGAVKLVESKRTITLEVSPQDALKVQTSMQLGTMALIMRAPEDDRAPMVTEVGANQIDSNYGIPRNNQVQKQTCSKGTMRVGGKEYLVDCDGSLTQVLNPDEP